MSCFDEACHLAQHLLVHCFLAHLGVPDSSALARAETSAEIPDSIQSSKVRKEEDFENFICWACNSLAGLGTTVICDNVRPHA